MSKTINDRSITGDSIAQYVVNAGGKTSLITHKSRTAEVKLDAQKNTVIHSTHHNEDSGFMERGFCFDDDMSTGSFNEIEIVGAHISINRISTNKTRIMDAEITSPFIEMLFLLEGEANETYDRHLCKITRNQHNLFFRTFFKGKYHIEGKESQIFCIQLAENFYKRLIDERAGSLHNIFTGIENEKEYIKLTKQNLPITPDMKAIVYDMIKNNRTGYMKRLFLESKTIELFMLQIEQAEIANNGKLTKFKREDIDKIHAAKAFVEENMLDEFTLSDVCRTVGLNDFKLKKGFRELFGTTVFRYLSELKMDYGKRLILDEKKTIGETAFMLGYSELHHFSAAFRRRFGYAPRELK